MPPQLLYYCETSNNFVLDYKEVLLTLPHSISSMKGEYNVLRRLNSAIHSS